jgi:hypothetical protein
MFVGDTLKVLEQIPPPYTGEVVGRRRDSQTLIVSQRVIDPEDSCRHKISQEDVDQVMTSRYQDSNDGNP